MINSLVADLPEVYQTIYGHPELSSHVSRASRDRLEHIVRIHDAIRPLLGRPLKVLDLGCAQGYFSLNLAERGATVHGVDYLDENIAVCNALARENPSLAVTFVVGRIEDCIINLEPGQYDLVLGLSVFHHIVHEKGITVVQDLLGHAVAQSGALVLEFALREEPLYWAPAQPNDPRSLLTAVPFVHEVARHSTHLANIERPLFVASQKFWVLNDRASNFQHWTTDPHLLANGVYQASRRYFFGKDQVVKQYRLDHALGEINQSHFTNEIEFLRNPPAGFRAAELVVYNSNETEACIAMQRLPGRVLLELQRESVSFDSHAVLLAVLDQLASLEAAGLFHNDVRTWNVLVSEEGAVHLIDYGSISPVAQDCVWPGNPFFAFFIFLREVVTGEVDDPDPLRSISISPLRLPQRYQAWATALWHRPLIDWSFRLMYQTLLSDIEDGVLHPSQGNSRDVWMQAMEEALQTQKKFGQHLRQSLHAVQADYQAFSETTSRQTIAAVDKTTKVAKEAVTVADNATSIAQQAHASADSACSIAQHANASAVRASSAAQQSVASSSAASTVAQRAMAETSQTRELVVHLEAMLQSLQDLTVSRDQRINELLNSTSWRVTAPLRWLSVGLRRAIAAPWRLFKFAARSLLLPPMRVVLGRPGLRQRISAVLKRFPTIARHLHLMAIHRGLVHQPVAHVEAMPTVECSAESPSQPIIEVATGSSYPLTPHARKIFNDLKTAVERTKT